MWDLWQVTAPLWASVCSCVKYGVESSKVLPSLHSLVQSVPEAARLIRVYTYVLVCMHVYTDPCIHGNVWEAVSSSLRVSPHPGCLPRTSLRSLPLSISPLSRFVPSPLIVSIAPSLLGSLPPPFFWSFSSSLLCVDISSLFLAFLVLSSPVLPACRQAHVPLSAGPRAPVTCGFEVSVGFLASVQGFVSSPFPSLHLLAKISAATLGLAGGSCPALKWVECEGVGIPHVPCSLASGLGLGTEGCFLGGGAGASRREPCLGC